MVIRIGILLMSDMYGESAGPVPLLMMTSALAFVVGGAVIFVRVYPNAETLEVKWSVYSPSLNPANAAKLFRGGLCKGSPLKQTLNSTLPSKKTPSTRFPPSEIDANRRLDCRLSTRTVITIERAFIEPHHSSPQSTSNSCMMFTLSVDGFHLTVQTEPDTGQQLDHLQSLWISFKTGRTLTR
ncbi:hypothetical protein BXZ70DRAFT_283926 [Cristinia sonorae]|uniref:Uncharacterized protein n=1 Tax=Cristinia sonorae TaxID=1940300 RepID=A0A8K0V0M3_9AGAR|nr:hypothetical protein BXZ70DRAFT_283926 [Cristinia sonorae]